MFCLGAMVFTHATAATVSIGGTGAAVGTMRLLGKAFEQVQSQHAVRVFDSLGTTGGVMALRSGRLDIAVTSRNITPAEEEGGLVARKYGTTAFIFVSHPDTAPLPLTPERIAEIYTDQFAAWPDGKPLRLVLRPLSDADTRQLGRISPEVEHAVAAAHAREGMIMAVTDIESADQVETTPGAFATSTLAVILSEGRHVTVHPMDGTLPSQESLAKGSYPLVRDLYMFTYRQPSDAAGEFLTFVSSPPGAEILRATGHKID